MERCNEGRDGYRKRSLAINKKILRLVVYGRLAGFTFLEGMIIIKYCFICNKIWGYKRENYEDNPR